MRVAIECKSPLMQKSLELFLKKYLSPQRNADIIIRDFKSDDRNFYISSSSEADLIKPFSRSQLLLTLEKKYKELNKDEVLKNYTSEDTLDFEILQRRIESLTKEYQDGIIKAVKAFYEK